MLRLARDLLGPQLWCVGRDIHHPDGNALLRYGFERIRPPAGESGSSAYVLSGAGGARCVLWRFGAFCDAPSLRAGIVLRRHPFVIRLADASSVTLPLWRAEQLPVAGMVHAPEAVRLTLRLGAPATRARPTRCGALDSPTPRRPSGTRRGGAGPVPRSR